MYAKVADIQKHINNRGLPKVFNADKDKVDGIFSREIYGVTSDEVYTKAAAIPLNTVVMQPLMLTEIKSVDRRIYECCTSKTNFTVIDGVLTKVVNPDKFREENPGVIIGYGPGFLFNIWNSLDSKKFIRDKGKLANILMAEAITKYRREEYFTTYQYTIPIGYREEDQDSKMIFNPTNQLYAEIAKFAMLIKANSNTMDTTDLTVYLQNKVLELFDLNCNIFGSHGIIVKNLLSRPVDNSATGVLLPATFNDSVIGNSRFNMDTIGTPIYHVNRTYIYHTKSNFPIVVRALFDAGYFDDDVTQEHLLVYDNDFISHIIDVFGDGFNKVAAFPAIKADGTFGVLEIPMEIVETVKDGEFKTAEKITPVTKVLTWIEFFYILHMKFSKIETSVFSLVTRYPIDRDKSLQTLRPVVTTISDELLKTVNVLGFKNIKHFPYITADVAARYNDKIFETGMRSAATVTVASNGDHDGDKVGFKPVSSIEAVEENFEYHNKLVSIFDYLGDFSSRKVGKASAQMLYTFSRQPKPSDKSKHITRGDKYSFIDYILDSEDGKIDLTVIYKYTLVYGDLKKPVYSIYDTVTFTRNKKSITSTLGQLILNKIIFARFWNNPDIEFYYEINEGIFCEIMSDFHQLCIEESITIDDIRRTVDLYCESTLRLSSMYNASLTDTMLSPGAKFRAYRDQEFDKVRDQIIAHRDVALFDKTRDKVIEFAKQFFKDDDMIELYESKGKSKWTGDFTAMQIALGGVASIISDKPNMILTALSDGIPFSASSIMANTAMSGAVDRGKLTALAGEQYKNITNATQSIMGYIGDCGSDLGVTVNYNKKILLYNKFVINKDKSLTKITSKNVDKYIGKDILIRSPFTCKVKNGNFCSTCTGTTPFDSTKSASVNFGMYINDLASDLMNLFMSSSHDLVIQVFNIGDLNSYLYPSRPTPLFTTRIDPIDNIEKIYCNEDITWKVPKSAITATDTTFHVLAHGSIIYTEDKPTNETPASSVAFTLGTEIETNPTNIISPDTIENKDSKHYLLRYMKGEVFVESTSTYRKTQTVYKMLQLFLRGTVSNLIPLETHLTTLKSTFNSNKKLADNDLGLNILLGTLARNAANPAIAARIKPSAPYIFVGTDDLITLANTFNGMIGPNAKRSMFTAMARSYDQQTQNPSPIEVAFNS